MSADGPEDTVKGPRPGPGAVLSALASASAVAAVGVFCALCYPILKELRAERVRAEDGTEERMLGFWSILVLSVLVGCVCCSLSWTLTYLDVTFPKPLTLHHLRDDPDPLIRYGVAVLNGLVASLTVVWSLC